MGRRLTIPTRERGELPLYVIYATDGALEETWKTLPPEMLTLIPRVSVEAYNHALHGYTQPLHKALGLVPKDALKKLLPVLGLCYSASTCPMHDAATCRARSPKKPWCFEPGGVDDVPSRSRAAEVIGFWAEGVTVIVVEAGQGG